MKPDDAERLLDRIGGLSHPCDLDLLVFFGRHPRTLITSEQLSTWLGYEPKQIATSLEKLLDGGFLTRAQTQAHAARLYMLVAGTTDGGWLPPLMQVASTRAGRLALREALKRRAPTPARKDPTPGTDEISTAQSRPRPFVVRRRAEDASNSKVR